MKFSGQQLGLLALAASYALYLPLLAWRGAWVDIGVGWHDFVTSTEFEVYGRGTLNLLVWAIFGHIALHSILRSRSSFFGNAFAIASHAVALPIFGMMSWAWPHMASQNAELAWQEATTWFWFSTGFWLVSVLFIAWALREAKHWSWPAWLVGGLCIGIPIWAVELSGAALMAAAAVWLWYRPPQSKTEGTVADT